MITVSKATKQDLGAIIELGKHYFLKPLFPPLSKAMFNNRDIALQARLDSGELVGFLWTGIMANGTIAYVDKVMVHPDYSGKRLVLPALYKDLFSKCYKRGVKEVFGIIRRDEYHDKSAKAALVMAWGGDSVPYTYVFGNLEKMKKELETNYVR